MERAVKHLLIIASLMTVELSLIESKDNENKKKIKNDRLHYQPVFTNICDIVDRRSKVHCYCDSTLPKAATWADCWIFTGHITEDDPMWPSFSSQPLIQDLVFNVRSDDALRFIPSKALVRLDKLTSLTIQFATLETIPQFAFTNSSTLKEIVLKSNKIANLDVNSFSKLMMLSNLSLEDNQITELKRGVFFGLPNLHVLHLSNNNLNLIHEGCFKHLNNLVELKLDSNFLSIVTREMFEGLENLSKLDLRSNKLVMIGNLAFSDIWGLKELYLDNNAIEYISERALVGLAQLKKLTLSGNKLTAFYEDIIDDIHSLTLLDLSDNLLETISYETIRSVIGSDKSTGVIYLNGNPFTCDCRLSWIYAIRNKTDSTNLRKALSQVSCVSDPTLNLQLLLKNKSTNTDVIKLSDAYEYYDEKPENVLYDEPKSMESRIKLLVNIPANLLPCPQELEQFMDDSSHPVQNEIRLKAYSSSRSFAFDFRVIVLMLHMTLF